MMKTVTVRDMVLGDGEPKICVPVIAHSYGELVHVLKELEAACFDLVEFRADFYFDEDAPALEAVRKAAGSRPVLYTVRTIEEGGEITISDDQYRKRILAASPLADLVDIQLARLSGRTGDGRTHSDLVSWVKATGAKVVLSWHDFEATPSRQELVEKMCAMQRAGCDIAKVAVMPNSRQDVLALVEASVEMLEHRAECPFITMSMGNLGKVTRAMGAFTGSCITFGMAGAQSAPGQIPSDSLREILSALDCVT